MIPNFHKLILAVHNFLWDNSGETVKVSVSHLKNNSRVIAKSYGNKQCNKRCDAYTPASESWVNYWLRSHFWLIPLLAQVSPTDPLCLPWKSVVWLPLKSFLLVIGWWWTGVEGENCNMYMLLMEQVTLWTQIIRIKYRSLSRVIK